MNPRTSSRRSFRKAKTFLEELNVFPTNEDEDLHDIRNQILSTRLYFILLILSVVGLFIYTSLVSVIETVIVKQPTYSQYQQLVANKINPQCQCKQTSIAFDRFVDLQAHYHPICSSDFISDKWIDFLSNLTELPDMYLSDFRLTAVYSFQFLRLLCELARTTVTEMIQHQLQIKSYFSSHVRTVDIFEEELRSFLDILIVTEQTNFVQLLTKFCNLVVSQNLVSTLSTNLIHFLPTHVLIPNRPRFTYHTQRVYYNKTTQTTCRCSYSRCIQEYEIRDTTNHTTLFTVPDFYTGCFIAESLLESSLTCFYNQTCIEQLLFHLNSSSFTISIPPNPLSDELFINQTINEFARHLMVDKWNRSFHFVKYYELCEPLECIYIYDHRFVITYIFAALSGIIGGLVTILRLLVPKVVQMIRHKRKTGGPKILIWPWLLEKLKSFNLFQSNPPSTDYEITRPQVISTYIYILVFGITLICLTIHTGIRSHTITVIVSSPSIKQYEDLKVQYSDTLTCECTQISTDLQTFIQLKPKYHEICSSIFVTNIWYHYLTSYAENRPGGTLSHPKDFRISIGKNFFYILESFCKISQETIQNNLKIFESTNYITKTVVERLTFLEQQNRTIKLFKTTLHTTVILPSEIFMNIVQWNSLYASSETAYRPMMMYSPSFSVDIHSLFDGRCTCLYHNLHCLNEAYIVVNETNTNIAGEHFWTVPGILTGCYPIWGAAKSNLFCLYDDLCLSELIKYLQPTYKMNVTALKKHLPTSIFNSNTTIEAITYELMVERWEQTVSYEQYYKKCNPKQCTHTYIQRFLITYIITTVLGIIGGLALLLRFVIPNLIKLLRKTLMRIQNNEDQNEDETSYNVQPKILPVKIIKFIETLNLFKSVSTRPPSKPILEHQNQLKIQLQIVSTRVYILLLFLSTITIIIYTSLLNTAETKVFPVVSYTDYQKLLNQYSSSSLYCPCTIISTEYSMFLLFKPKSAHPVCHERLFDPDWTATPLGFDVRPIEENLSLFLMFYLRFARIFCKYSQHLIDQKLEQFLTTFYTASFLTQREQFEQYFSLQMNQFQKTLPSNYNRYIDMSRAIISANSLLPAAKTNYEWDFVKVPGSEFHAPHIPEIIQLKTKLKKYYNQTYTCHIPSKFYKKQLYWPNTRIPVPGMYISCYLVDGFLQSTFECFFNVTCVELIKVHVLSPYNLSRLMPKLPSNSSRYQTNSTVQELLNILFVDQWFSNISYELYYDQCQPKECYYTYINRFGILYIITMMFSIVSGLMKVLPVLIPLFIKICYKHLQYFKGKRFHRRQRNNNRVDPIISSLST